GIEINVNMNKLFVRSNNGVILRSNLRQPRTKCYDYIRFFYSLQYIFICPHSKMTSIYWMVIRKNIMSAKCGHNRNSEFLRKLDQTIFSLGPFHVDPCDNEWRLCCAKQLFCILDLR